MPKGISNKTAQKRASNRDEAKGPKRTPDEILRDRAEITRLRLLNKTQTEIAEHLAKMRPYTLSQPTIHYDLKVSREEWMSTSNENHEKHREIELARIDDEEIIISKAWDDSCRPRRKVKHKTVMKDDEVIEEITIETEESVVKTDKGESWIAVRDGNPAFLTRLEAIRQRRCEILGFPAQQKSQDINAAIDVLLKAGYIVRFPKEGEA
jgi:hypothetical protein